MDVNRLCPNCMNETEGQVCAKCGYDRGETQDNSHALKPYTILSGKYLVGNVIGEGGFGITYIGFDLNLEMKIAVKEFYPNGYVTRESGVTSLITSYTTNDPKQFQKWKDSFVREARNLAKFSNLPGIVHVRDFFQENNTAYIIMEYIEGESLQGYLRQRSTPMGVEETLEMMRPVIKSLSRIHEAGIIHRDISPDNIMIESGGDIKLIDFGAAREFEEGNERSMSVLLKPGYAPEEQYRTKGEQGPWTDVYALCATMYRCITGKKPVESMERMRQDTLALPSALGISIDPGIETVLMNGMAVYAEKRIRDMNTLYYALYKGEVTIDGAGVQRQNVSSSGGASEQNKKKSNEARHINNTGLNRGGLNPGVKYALIGGAVVLVLLLIVVLAFNAGKGSGTESSKAALEQSAPEADSQSTAGGESAADTAAAPEQAAANDEGNTKAGDSDSDDGEAGAVETTEAAEATESSMPEPLTDEELYRNKYADIVSAYWEDADHAGWNIEGMEIINLNSDESDTPEVVILWDVNKDNIIGQSIYGIDCDKDSKCITSSSVYGYNLEIYRDDSGSTVAYTVNESGVTYLLDSNESKAFSFPLTNDEEFDYSIREEFVSRVPEVFERAVNTPAKWSPDNSVYYRVYADEREEVANEILLGKDRMDLYYVECYIPYSDSGQDKLEKWNEAWEAAWDMYKEQW